MKSILEVIESINYYTIINAITRLSSENEDEGEDKEWELEKRKRGIRSLKLVKRIMRLFTSDIEHFVEEYCGYDYEYEYIHSGRYSLVLRYGKYAIQLSRTYTHDIEKDVSKLPNFWWVNHVYKHAKFGSIYVIICEYLPKKASYDDVLFLRNVAMEYGYEFVDAHEWNIRKDGDGIPRIIDYDCVKSAVICCYLGISDGDEFCYRCHRRVICSHCKHEIAKGSKFCANCGTKI